MIFSDSIRPRGLADWRMADRELAAKLAQRVTAIGDETPPPPPSIPPPPVAADPPKENTENPFVAPSTAFSIDDLVRETLENSNNNNNNNNNNTSKTTAPPLPVSPPPPLPTKSAHPPMVPLFDAPRPESPVPESKQRLVRIGRVSDAPLASPRPQTPTLDRRGFPPMVPLVEPERPESPVPVSKQPLVRLCKGETAVPLSPPASPAPPPPLKAPPMIPLVQPEPGNSPVAVGNQPVVRVERGTNLPTTPVQKQKFVADPGDGGAELEKRLEAQRIKKASAAPPVSNFDPIMREIERLERSEPTPHLPQCPPPFIPGVSMPPPPPAFKPPPVPSSSRDASAVTAVESTPCVSSPPDTDAPPPPPAPFFEAPPPPSLISTASTDQPIPPVETAQPEGEECASAVPSLAPPPSPLPIPSPPPPPKSVCPIQSPKMVVDTAPLTALDINANGLKPVSKASPASTCGSDDSDELAAKLARRNMINEGETAPQMITKGTGTYNEFPEFSRKQLKYFSETFKKYDEDKDNFIDFNELKRMMEKLGEPQTHVALKQIIKKVDEDQDGKVSMREFLLIFRYAAGGELGLSSEVFKQLADSVDVRKEGVHGAAEFFQAKIAEQSKLSKFEEEIKAEQEERKKEEEEKKERKKKFLESKSIFH